MTQPSTPIMVHTVGSSVTPFTDNGANPSFMTHDIDVETFLPMNKHTYWFDLTKANAEGQPTWVNHDYLDFYNLKDLSPASMFEFAKSIKDDKDFASQWNWMRFREANELEIISDKLQLENFCDLVSSEFHEMMECLESKGDSVGSEYGKFSRNHLGLIDWIIHNWIKVTK